MDGRGSEVNTQLSEFDACAREPLHKIGHIQPHGLLFAISEPDFMVRHVSANVSFLLGVSVETVLGYSIENVLGSRQFEAFRCQVRDDIAALNSQRFRVGGNGLELQCVAHRRDGLLILELELLEGAQSLEPINLNTHIGRPLARMELADGIPELSQIAVNEIRHLSGFHHVMVCQFDNEWNGVVTAEAMEPSPMSYLGLRFPTNEIPAQTQGLFLLNRVLAIVDIEAAPVPVVPEIGPLMGTALDLTGSLLCNPASSNLEQLRSMGVRSSLTMSIRVKHKLWGLIVCHHALPRHVDYSIRSVCDLMAQLLGSQLALRIDNAAFNKIEHCSQLMVEAAPCAMIMVGSNGRILLANKQSEILFGYDHQQLLGRPIEILLPKRFRTNHGARLTTFFAAPRAREMGVGRDLLGLRSDGSEVPVEIGLSSISTSDGDVVLASIIDITARKKTEQEAIERTKQLSFANQELEEFAYIASHDLKAPLRVIDNTSQWLEEDLTEGLTDETRKTLRLLRGRVRRMDTLLDNLLEYARIGRSPDNLHPEVISGDLLMEDVLGLLPIEDFKLAISPAFASIQVSRMPLQQILLNLVGNAIKHHDKKNGCIEVTVEDNGDHYAFSVKDDGPGIHPQFHDAIFRMFQTLKPRDEVEGNGMGLALVRKNIEVFGGIIQLESAEGQGSTFRFTWPKQTQPSREDGRNG